MNKKQFAVAAALAASLAAAGPVHAVDGMAMTGVDLAKQSFYVYGGLALKLSGTMRESGPMLRVWGDRQRYKFGRPVAIDADSHTGSLAVGWQLMRPTGHFSTYLGAARRSTSHTPPFPSGESTEDRWGALVQLDLSQQLGTVGRFETIAHYLTNLDEYWVRGRMLFGAGPVNIGPELVVQGSDEYDGWRVGLALADWKVVDQLSVSLASGYEDRDRVEAGGYFNLGLAVPF